MWETLEELLSKSLNEICLFYIPFRGNGCGTYQRQKIITGCFENLQARINPQSRIHCKRSHFTITDAFWKVIHLCLTYNSCWIHSVNKSKRSHNDMNSREVLTFRKHTYTDIRKQNNIQLWIFWLSRLLCCSSLSLMATPHLEIVSWEWSLEPEIVQLPWHAPMPLGVEAAVDEWTSWSITNFLAGLGWYQSSLCNKGSWLQRNNSCSLGVNSSASIRGSLTNTIQTETSSNYMHLE